MRAKKYSDRLPRTILFLVRSLSVVATILVGSLAIIAGEKDDSPGLQGLGCILIFSTLSLIFLTRSKRGDQSQFSLRPIGFVESSRKEATDDNWDSEKSQIVLVESFSENPLEGLDAFSHCVVVYLFDKAEQKNMEVVRHPRGNIAWPRVGIFAQRAKDRPNRLGVTVCRIIEVKGRTIRLEGLDAIDRTPVVDIKPWMTEFGPRGEVSQPNWSKELMQNYW